MFSVVAGFVQGNTVQFDHDHGIQTLVSGETDRKGPTQKLDWRRKRTVEEIETNLFTFLVLDRVHPS